MMTTKQVAARIGCCAKSVRDRIGQPGFPQPVPHFKKYRWRDADVIAYCGDSKPIG